MTLGIGEALKAFSPQFFGGHQEEEINNGRQVERKPTMRQWESVIG